MPNSQVTWILPVKNAAGFIEHTLQSIARQSYPAAETLIWDNGSTDNTVKIARKWIPSRINGKIITENPLPLHLSLAALVERSQTNYCARIDADDISDPNRLAVQVAFLNSNPKTALIGTQILPIDPAGNPTNLRYPLPPSYSGIQDRLMKTNCISHPSVLFRRSAVLEVGNYNFTSPVEDYDLWLRLASQYHIANLQAALLQYRVHAQSVTHKALHQRSLQTDIDEAWIRNATHFLGIESPTTARKLRFRNLPFALPTLYRIATTFGLRDGVSPIRRFTVREFNHSCRNHVAPRDIPTRFFLKIAGNIT